MSSSGDMMNKFQEDNWDILLIKFLKEKEVKDLWEEFCYNEWMDSLADAPEDKED